MTFVCNVLWFLSCLPGAMVYLVAACFPRVTQERVLRRILRCNAATEYGRRHGFAAIGDSADYASRVPVSEYGDYEDAIRTIKCGGSRDRIVSEPVRVLEPTSGTGSGAKLIPYTRSLRREFLAAIRPWLAGLYLQKPALFLGRHYWSVSPNTRVDSDAVDAGVRVGFEDDTEYLGVVGRWVARRVLAVPPELGQVADAEAFTYLTLLFLLREPNVRLISVWHPSFLTILLDAIPTHWADLVDDIRAGSIRHGLDLPKPLRVTLQAYLRPMPKRAAALAELDPASPDTPGRIWPRLGVISCWTRECAPWLSRLQTAFPAAFIREKGLVATEGIVTVPLGADGRKAAAVCSHFLEFRDSASGDVKRLWELGPDSVYAVLLTTGGGLYRYCLHDRVEVEGRFLRTPCLRFLGREGAVSDMVGEKVDLSLAEEAISDAESRLSASLSFAMLAPHRDERGGCGYICFAALEDGGRDALWELAGLIETALQKGYHYRHARRLGQLRPLRVFELTGSPDAEYQARRTRDGIKRGDIKFLRLSCESGWHEVFRGRFVEV